MPRVYLDEWDRCCHRLAAYVQGEKKRTKVTDTEMADEHGISQPAMSRKLRVESFDFRDFLYFIHKFPPDGDTLRFILGI